jgi:hypothetical protein
VPARLPVVSAPIEWNKRKDRFRLAGVLRRNDHRLAVLVLQHDAADIRVLALLVERIGPP